MTLRVQSQVGRGGRKGAEEHEKRKEIARSER